MKSFNDNFYESLLYKMSSINLHWSAILFMNKKDTKDNL